MRGKFRPEKIRILIETHRTQLVKNLEHSLPELLPIFGAGGLYDAAFGKVDQEKFNELMVECFLHPVVIAKASFTEDLEVDVRIISNFFWDECEKLAKSINVFLLKIIEMRSRFDLSQFEIEKLFDEYFDDAQNRTTLFRVFSEKFNEFSMRDNHSSGTNNFANLMLLLLRKKLQAHTDPNKASEFARVAKLDRGDFGDLTHTVYQPYVDIFSCDRKTKNLLLESSCLKPDNICTSEAEIRERILEKNS